MRSRIPTTFQRRWRTATLTNREHEAIHFWRYGGYQEVCYALRHPRAAKAEPNAAEVANIIHSLDALTSRWAIGTPMRVFRGAWTTTIRKGDRVHHHCFLSTTTDLRIARSFLVQTPRGETDQRMTPTLFVIRLPPDQTALCIACLPPTSGQYLAEQHELVLPRGMTLRVVGVRATSAMVVAVAEVL